MPSIGNVDTNLVSKSHWSLSPNLDESSRLFFFGPTTSTLAQESSTPSDKQLAQKLGLSGAIWALEIREQDQDREKIPQETPRIMPVRRACRTTALKVRHCPGHCVACRRFYSGENI